MKVALAIAALLMLASVSEAGLFRRNAHGCQGTAAACTGSPTQACKGAVASACQGTVKAASCHGTAVVAAPRKVVVRTTVDACGVVTQTTRSRGTVLVAVPVQVQPVVEKIGPPAKK